MHTGLGLQRARGDPATAPGPASACPKPMMQRWIHDVGVQHVKSHQSQAQDTRSGRWGQFLSPRWRDTHDAQPQPRSLTPRCSYKGEQTGLLFPGDTSKSTSERRSHHCQPLPKLPRF